MLKKLFATSWTKKCNIGIGAVLSLLLTALFVGLPFLVLAAPSDGTLDTTFNTGANPGTDRESRVVAIQPDGKILIGGAFTNARGVSQNGIARLNTDGSLDTTFNTNANPGVEAGLPSQEGVVYTIAIQPDGKILIGGFFWTVRGAIQNNIARLNVDGSLDTTFNTGANPGVSDGFVNAVAIQPDGKILIGGAFTNARGVSQNGITRLNADGSLDTTFNIGNNIGMYIQIRAVAIQPDGKIVIGGFLPTAHGVTQNGIARLNVDGSLDTTFNTGANPGVSGGYVNALALQSDGKVVIGGSFTTVQGVVQNGIARLDANGSLDTTFNTGTNPGTTGAIPDVGVGYVLTITIQPDGKILIGGGFTNARGVTQNGIARLNTDGSLDTTFNIGANVGVNNDVYTIAIQPDGKIVIGGFLWMVRGVTQPHIARLATNEADVAISSYTATPNPVMAGQQLTFNLSLSQLGPSAVSSMVLTMPLPANTTFVSNNPATGWTCTTPAAGATGNVVCTIDSLNSAPVIGFQFTVQLAPGFSGSLTSVATVSSTTPDPNPANNTSTAIITVVISPAADVVVSGNVTAASVTPGQNVTYNFTIGNNGPSTAESLNFTIDIPADMTFQSFTAPAGWVCTTPAVGSGGAISCSSDNLGAGFKVGANQLFQLVLQVKQGTPDGKIDLVIGVAVLGATPDPVLTNNTIVLSVTVGQVQVEVNPSDVIAKLRLNPDREASTQAETLLVYTFSVQNIGKGRTSNLTLRFPVPSSLVVGYAVFEDKRVWVTNVLSEELVIALPGLEQDNIVTGTIVLRPNPQVAKAGDSLLLRYKLQYGDEVQPNKEDLSNGVTLYWGANNRDETNSNVQFLDLSIEGAVVNAGSRFFLAEEVINLWLTDASGKSVALQAGNGKADKAGNYRFAVDVNSLNLASGVYTLAAYGNRSMVTGAVSIRVEAVTSGNAHAQGQKYKLTAAPNQLFLKK